MAPSLTQLGRFDLIERLGVGGFGSVWKARDKELDRTVAIKIPRAGGMTPERVPEMLDFYGADIMLLIGGGLLATRERLTEETAAFVAAVQGHRYE